METSKACQDVDIPKNIIKENTDIFADTLIAIYNDSVEKSNFPLSLKKENITPAFKKGDRNSKANCRPVSIPPSLSKIFEP